MASIKQTLNKVIQAAEKQLTEEYTSRLRSHAQSYGWPSDLTDSLRIDYENGNHTIKYPSEVEDKILTLEYGTQHVPPMPAMRTFMLGNA